MHHWGQIFWQEIKTWVLAFLLAYFFFAAVNYAAGTPVIFLSYALVLAFLVFAGYALWHFFSWRRKIKAQLNHWQELNPDFNGKDRFYGELLREQEENKLALKRSYVDREREKEEYFTLWMHQMKTPLTSLNLLLREEKNLQQPALLENELIRLGEYCEWALAYLKLENPGTELDLVEVDLDNLIRSLLRKYRVQFVYQHIRLEFTETAQFPLSDSRWLSLMIEQLLSNALKYTPEGKSIRIYWSTEDESLVIEDEGVGIRPEDLRHVFSKGYSGLNGRLQEKSSGLGLYLVKRISERLGHSVSLDSELGKGTQVKLQLSTAQRDLPAKE